MPHFHERPARKSGHWPWADQVTGGFAMLKIRTILHPTDFSEHSRHAWDLACALAHDYRARIVVLHVREIPTALYGEFGAIPMEPLDAAELGKELARFKPPYADLKVE